jgi:hypothetical protein
MKPWRLTLWQPALWDAAPPEAVLGEQAFPLPTAVADAAAQKPPTTTEIKAAVGFATAGNNETTRAIHEEVAHEAREMIADEIAAIADGAQPLSADEARARIRAARERGIQKSEKWLRKGQQFEPTGKSLRSKTPQRRLRSRPSSISTATTPFGPNARGATMSSAPNRATKPLPRPASRRCSITNLACHWALLWCA